MGVGKKGKKGEKGCVGSSKTNGGALQGLIWTWTLVVRIASARSESITILSFWADLFKSNSRSDSPGETGWESSAVHVTVGWAMSVSYTIWAFTVLDLEIASDFGI